MEGAGCQKRLQKKFYDVLSHKHGLLLIIVVFFVVTLSSFFFGESVMEWSTEKYEAVFNSFSDNLAGRSYRDRLCLPVPIDIVYTWVNGTDPDLIRNLQRIKLEMQDELNITAKVRSCVFRNCLPNNMVVLDPEIPKTVSLLQLGLIHTGFSSAERLFTVSSPIDHKNYTAVVFPDREQVKEVVNKTILIRGVNTTVIQGYITTDSTVQNGIPLYEQIVMSGFPHTLSADQLKQALPDKHSTAIDKFELDADRGIAVLYVKSRDNFDNLLKEKNITIEGKEPSLSPAFFVWDLRDLSRDEDLSASRFEDNEELRYSLRSVERFAPWVRHVYIVTNGQLPNWLNLESPRVTIVTHEEIFDNSSHLPTFSSPAIESNLHKIPGLSDKFIYMNDDVMFGSEVWPDDFYTYSSGQKVYLTWPVPNCNEGCPSSWIKDGYCDKACNVSECEWDAGDCDGTNVNAQQQAGWANWNPDNTGYCNQGCANNWIADRYCDTACNVFECGFDAGDCGTDNYNKMYGMMLDVSVTSYTLTPGLSQGYFNLSRVLPNKNVTLKQAFYDDNKIIRTIAVGKKYNVLTVVLYADMNKTTLNFQLEYGVANTTVKHNFSLVVDTIPRKEIAVFHETDGKNVSTATNKTKPAPITEAPIVFAELHDSQLYPDVVLDPASETKADISALPANISSIVWPDHLLQQFQQIQEELKQEELTELGYHGRLQHLWQLYQTYLKHPDQHKPKPPTVPTKRRQGKITPIKSAGQNGVRPVGQRKLLFYLNDSLADSMSVYMQDGEGLFEKGVGLFEKGEGLFQKGEGLFEEEEWLNGINSEEEGFKGQLGDFVDVVDIQPDTVRLFPWEKNGIGKIQEERERKERGESYTIEGFTHRRLLDTFGDSLRHVNSLYNKAFGYTARKVPGHMPHMIDKHIMFELQHRFPGEWEATSGHKIRHSKDMQYAFSYFYYLMGLKENITADHVFDQMDTDHSKILSDREIRTLATRLYDLPLDLQTLSGLENMFMNCSKSLPSETLHQLDATHLETYYENEMPQVTRNMFINCDQIKELMAKKFPPKNKYKYIEVDDSQIAFKMIKSNVSTVVGQLDDIRKNPKKFICLNDNIEHNLEQAKTVKAILADFYESLFPVQSQFELPREYRNRFTHIDELREWRRYRDWLKFWTHVALVLLVIFTFTSYFSDKIEAAQKSLFGRRRPVKSSEFVPDADKSRLQTV